MVFYNTLQKFSVVFYRQTLKKNKLMAYLHALEMDFIITSCKATKKISLAG
jgi:hypothetical protein